MTKTQNYVSIMIILTAKIVRFKTFFHIMIYYFLVVKSPIEGEAGMSQLYTKLTLELWLDQSFIEHSLPGFESDTPDEGCFGWELSYHHDVLFICITAKIPRQPEHVEIC